MTKGEILGWEAVHELTLSHDPNVRCYGKLLKGFGLPAFEVVQELNNSREFPTGMIAVNFIKVCAIICSVFAQNPANRRTLAEAGVLLFAHDYYKAIQGHEMSPEEMREEVMRMRWDKLSGGQKLRDGILGIIDEIIQDGKSNVNSAGKADRDSKADTAR